MTAPTWMTWTQLAGGGLGVAPQIINTAGGGLGVAPQKVNTAPQIINTAPQTIRDAIADELAQPKYRLGPSWWERVMSWLQEAWVRFLEWAAAISEYVGGPVVLALLVGGALIALAVVVTANLGRRRARRVDERIRREHEAARGLDPADLEERATEAEASGDYAAALRLLFRASLIRLDRADMIDLRPGTTSGTVADSVGSDDFTALALRFDAVVYGDAPASESDPAMARRVVASLLAGAAR